VTATATIEAQGLLSPSEPCAKSLEAQVHRGDPAGGDSLNALRPTTRAAPRRPHQRVGQPTTLRTSGDSQSPHDRRTHIPSLENVDAMNNALPPADKPPGQSSPEESYSPPSRRERRLRGWSLLLLACGAFFLRHARACRNPETDAGDATRPHSSGGDHGSHCEEGQHWRLPRRNRHRHACLHIFNYAAGKRNDDCRELRRRSNGEERLWPPVTLVGRWSQLCPCLHGSAGHNEIETLLE
jgi:hypothetical protein